MSIKRKPRVKSPTEKSNEVIVTYVGRKDVPTFVQTLHHFAVSGKADRYVKGHIAGFIVTEHDVAIYPHLEGVEQVFLCYRTGEPASVT